MKTENRKNEIIKLKNEIVKVTSRFSEREGELSELKAGMIIFQKEVAHEVETLALMVKNMKGSLRRPSEGPSEGDFSRSRSNSLQSPTIIEKNDEDDT